MLTIDRAFVDGLGHSQEDTVIVEHVVGMAKALNMVTVAEGVEQEIQIERLRQLSCDLAQGFYYSEPQPPYVIAELLSAAGDEEWRPPARPGDEDDAAAPVVTVSEGQDDGRFDSSGTSRIEPPAAAEA
jgi:predicted signal transduction protein with EAL and GGDEF domain